MAQPTSNIDSERLRCEIRKEYAEVATHPEKGLQRRLGSSKELVTHAMYCDDVPRLSRVLLDLLAEPSDVIVDSTSEGEIVIAPDFIEELVARNRFTKVLDEVFHHSEFARGKLQRLSPLLRQMLAKVQFDIGEPIKIRLSALS